LREFTEAYFRAGELVRSHNQKNRGKTFSGRFTWKLRDEIKQVIDRFDITTMLDYGCGAGKQYDRADPRNEGQPLEEYWNLVPTKYDPYFPQFESQPAGTFGLVICVQVLNNVPKSDLPAFVDRLYSYASRVLFVAERLGAPRKQIHSSIKGVMPYEFGIDDWTSTLRRPGSLVRLVGLFRSPDEWKGWRHIEPCDQG
jgi:hypothetical protein